MRILISFLFGLALSAAPSDVGFAKLQRGPMAVGWTVVRQFDYSRAYLKPVDLVTGRPVTAEPARPMQMLIWYPAKAGGAPVRYADYLATEATDQVFDQSKADLANFLDKQHRNAVARLGGAQARAMFEQSMWAVKDASPIQGKFPIVIYGPGVGGVAHEVADLAELLASHGYVVISSRSMGPNSSLMSTDRAGIEAQVRDYQFLMSFAHSLPQADVRQMALVGWSWGGMTNVFVAERDHRVRALVSLDGTREPEFTKALSPHSLRVPWLYVQRHPQTVAELAAAGIESSFSLLNEAKWADLYQVVMYPMEHVDFSSAALRLARPSHFGEYTRGEVEQAYAWTARYVLAFLDAQIKKDPAASAFLERRPVENGVPAHMARISHRAPASGPLPTREGFAASLASQGFGQASTIYRDLHAANPSFSLSDNDINQWGYQLWEREGHPANAVALFQFGTQLYPANGNLFDSLGEAQEAAGNLQGALVSYRRSLELDPANGHARDRIAHLVSVGAK
ncbi:MAG TPA: alpha/beta fold hydrolase [Holophagaceae bacterium]|nr:alpha/beta fold hydrolase [Holophagaceae bacterium]